MTATSPLDRTDPFLTIEEVAAELRQQPSTLYGWRARRVGPPAVKVGRRLLYRRSGLDNWLISRSSEAL